MKFTLYASAKNFAADVLSILKRHEIQNNLLIKNVEMGLGSEDNSNMVMASVKNDSGDVILTAVRTLPHPMVMYETDNIRNDDVLDFFVRSLIENNISVDFIMTVKSLAKKFTEIYSRLTENNFYNNESLVLYLLDCVNDIVIPNGRFRAANENDMFYLPYWYADFPPACNIGEYDLASGIEGAKRGIEKGVAYIWEDDFPVSLAGSVRRTSDCAIIGQVYTPPHLRGKGYSSACVSKLSQKLLDDGFRHCALYADCANQFSNRVYQKVGYKEIFWYDQYKLVKE